MKLANGATIADLGLSQDTITTRGFSIQARVVATGTGTLAAYSAPSGAGIRVDGSGCKYTRNPPHKNLISSVLSEILLAVTDVGYTPAPQFDPLLAKVICSHPSENFQSAIDRSIRALEEFHIDGVATNLAPLRAILAQ